MIIGAHGLLYVLDTVYSYKDIASPGIIYHSRIWTYGQRYSETDISPTQRGKTDRNRNRSWACLGSLQGQPLLDKMHYKA